MGGGTILLGRGEKAVELQLALANRHGLIAGATGTGKTITLQVLAESLSRAGVPVFCADVKGDLSGLAMPGKANPKLEKRAAELGVQGFAYEAAPVIFWDLFGRQGHPIRTTVSEMGPLLLARLLELNEAQEGVLNIAFKIADEEGLLLLDLKDLTAILQYVAEQADRLTTAYGNVSKATVGTIQRRLLTLEQQGGDHLFGEPALALADLMLTTPDGRGAVNVLMADQLMQSPRLYATFLLWLLSELFEELPEVGDRDKPKLVFFFDEAHLLFKDAPKALTEKVEQVVRLIRSKGVGVYFVTQNPLDVPSTVLGQLGNRVQHALRAFTPLEQKAVRAAAETFRPNPKFKTEAVITELAVGEALVSMLEPGGVPGIVERARICPPRSRIGPLLEEERRQLLAQSPLAGKYDMPVDRESAYEILQRRATSLAAALEPHLPEDGPWGGQPAPSRAGSPWGTAPAGTARRIDGGLDPAATTAPPPMARTRRRTLEPPPAAAPRSTRPARQSVGEAVAKSLARGLSTAVGRQIGNALVRGLLGSLLKR